MVWKVLTLRGRQGLGKSALIAKLGGQWFSDTFTTMHGGGCAPSCCAFTHSVAFEEESGTRVLLKSGPGNRGCSACGTTHVARLEFSRETGLLLRCAGKAGNPFQTTQGNRLSCRDQEWRRGSDEAVPGPSVFPSGNPACRGSFGGRSKAVRDHFALQGGTGDFP